MLDPWFNWGFISKTVTSIEPFEWSNESGDIEYLPKNAKIVDYPGYPRLRNGMHSYLSNTKAIIFVVDSRNVGDEAIQSSGELLAHVLTRPAFVEQNIPIFMACNKSDMHGAKSDDFIFKRLEKELDKLKDTRSVLMETEGGDGGEGSNEIMLGTEERFEFDVDVASGVIPDRAVARNATLMLYTTSCKICMIIRYISTTFVQGNGVHVSTDRKCAVTIFFLRRFQSFSNYKQVSARLIIHMFLRVLVFFVCYFIEREKISIHVK